MAPKITTAEPCRILSLDGGGAKGFYTLGVLKQLEAIAGPLHERFDLIFGTITGAIIAALLALGKPVDEVHRLYRQHVPAVMRRRAKVTKSAALKRLALEVFKDKKFTDVKTSVGIVATRWAFERPMIFKHSVAQAHGRHATFVPGFGCTIAEAVRASCSAYPFFLKTKSRRRTDRYCSSMMGIAPITLRSMPSPTG
jgi:patatin-like phospholipase/acyl hydrolase